MLQKILFRNAVERVLHVKGNYRGGILEMAMVFDCNLSKETVKPLAQEAVAALRQQGEVFRNVRLNTIVWESDLEIKKEVSAMAFLQTGAFFDAYEQKMQCKRTELLMEQLKKFYARSKLIIMITDGQNRIEDEELFVQSMKPFLEKKLVMVDAAGGVR